MNNIDTPLILNPTFQNYHWGKIGEQSLCARLLTNFDKKLPYAELWYGSHPKSPSKVISSSKQTDFKTSIQFLAKILSINNALSIQAHPSLKDASYLHAKDPGNYPDKNHKPEIAVALTQVKLLHGWISKSELNQIISIFPEVNNFFTKYGLDLANWNDQTRNEIIKILFTREKPEIAAFNNLLLKKALAAPEKNEKQELVLLLSRHADLADPGIVLGLFLRLLTLEAGEYIYTPEGVIHAYLSGDLFECMANSDNVIRAGLTPKFQDYEALLKCASFGEESLFKQLPTKEESSPFLSYTTNAKEFRLRSVQNLTKKISYQKAEKDIEMLVLLDGSSEVEVDGSSYKLIKGHALFIPSKSHKISLDLKEASIFRISSEDLEFSSERN